MRVREAQLQTLARAILDTLTKQGFLRAKADASVIQQRIAAIIGESFRIEAEIEEEAERLAQAHARQMSGMDQRRIIQGIMQRIAEERGFAL